MIRGQARFGWFALALWLVGVSPAQAGDTIYSFVDERGVIHFSNVPNDPRYKEVKKLASLRPILRSSRSVRRGPPSIADYDFLIRDEASRHGLAPALVKAVIAAESNFDPAAVSHKGAMGLMQLMPDTARILGVESPFESEENVRGGVRYLRSLLDRYGSLSHALAAYNAGPGNVDRYGGIPPYRETEEYVERVLAYYRVYDGDF